MKKKILSILIVLSLIITSCAALALPASAAIHGYGIFVGGIEINEENAADVLGDGTVSYDDENCILTLNNANITDYLTQELNGEDCYYGIYSTVDGLTVNLVGENKMIIKNPLEDDTASAIHSEKALTISGEGSIDIKCWSGVTCMDDLTVKDCKMSFSTIGLTGMKDITVDGATLGADYSLIMAPNGEISIKNTTITEGGIGTTIYSELGTVSIEDSSITANALSDDGCPIYVGDKLTVKNTTLDLSSSGTMTIMCGQLDFDGVTGSVEMVCEAGYAIMAGSVRMKNSELDISVIATKDSAVGIFTEDQDVSLENCSLKIDVRGGKDASVGIETLAGDIKATGCTLDIVSKNDGAFALYGSNVALTDCSLTASVTAIATEDTFGAGIFAESGSVKIIGGMIDLTVSGPVFESPQISAGINMTNTLLQPELTDVNLKIKAPVVMTSAPYLTHYGRDYEITVSKDIYGDSPEEYNADDILSYKYFHIHGLYTVTFDANGGEGEMSAAEKQYGEYTLPMNGFTATDGATFLGWALSPDGEIIEGDKIDVQKDITLYAIWELTDTGNETDQNTEPPVGDDPNHAHSFGNEWKYTETEHYKECACGAKQYVGEHIDSNGNGSCDVCGYTGTDEEGGCASGCGSFVGFSSAVIVTSALMGAWLIIKKKEK